ILIVFVVDRLHQLLVVVVQDRIPNSGFDPIAVGGTEIGAVLFDTRIGDQPEAARLFALAVVRMFGGAIAYELDLRRRGFASLGMARRRGGKCRKREPAEQRKASKGHHMVREMGTTAEPYIVFSKISRPM